VQVPIQNQLIGGQGPLQALLILIAFVSVPMLLFPKPFLLKREHEAKLAQRGSQFTSFTGARVQILTHRLQQAASNRSTTSRMKSRMITVGTGMGMARSSSLGRLWCTR